MKKRVDYMTDMGLIEMEDEEELKKNFYKRMTKVMISKAGGTAAESALKYKVGLPNAWMSEMDIRKGHRTFVMEKVDDKTITLTLTDVTDP